ncbi:MAG TPA: CBS domain-containing protein [Candidatus Binataceae bacterium]|jgi:CBS domain-containing protein|nr:CBS domain-containing protein [Candidatus Binataceae bacterium]
MQVERIMIRDVKTCSANDTLNRAAQLMWENDCGCIPVIAADGDGRVIGIVTDRDICMAAYTQGRPLFEIPVASAMARKVIACSPTDDLKRAETLMHDNQIRRLPVLDERGRLLGIISINDIAREAARERASRRGAVEVSDAEIGYTFEGICQPHRHDGPAA